MSQELTPLLVINVVGLTPALLQYTPTIRSIAEGGSLQPLSGSFPGLTLPAQASMLTGKLPREHGVVGNGWYRSELGESRFWVQANTQLGQRPVYEIAREKAESQGLSFSCAKLFWWFNQGAKVDWAVTPKPHYGSDGSKVFDILSQPHDLASALKDTYGSFPFHEFWGPRSGLASSRWISDVACWLMDAKKPTLHFVYLPHLDYDLQRYGPGGADLSKILGEVDQCVEKLYKHAQKQGAEVLIVSEYGITDVSKTLFPNRILRSHKFLALRDGPFGEHIDFTASRGFALCDHQIAHIYLRDKADSKGLFSLFSEQENIAQVLGAEEQEEFGIDHHKSGDLILVAKHDTWFPYYYWEDQDKAPDFARTIDIHRKPGYDPCELFIDPEIPFPKLKVLGTLLRKKIGMRYRMNIIPLDPDLVKGSHGALPARPEQGPLVISTRKNSLPPEFHVTHFPALILNHLGFE